MNVTTLSAKCAKNDNNEMIWLQLALSGTFVISPLLGVLITTIFGWLLNTWRLSKFTTVVLTLFMWCMESTRTFINVERGDFPTYMSIFDIAGSTPLLKLIFHPTTSSDLPSGAPTAEYGWQILNHLGSIIFNGDFLHFAYFWIALSYFIVFMALYKYMKSVGANFRYYLCAIVFFSFLAPYFAICNNLFRQQTSMSLVIYTLVVKIVDRKFKWWLLIIATSFHTMCIAFLPLFFVKVYKKPTLKFIAILAVCFVMVFMLVQRLDMFSVFSLGIFQKLASASEYSGTDVMETTAAVKFFILVTFMYATIIGLQKNVHPNIIAMTNITIMMALLYILLDPLPLIQVRYYITRLVFLPFIVPFLLGKNNIIANLYTAGIIIIYLYIFFNTEFDHFKFTFYELLSNTFFNYILI